MGTAQHLIAIALDYIEDGKNEGDFYSDRRAVECCTRRNISLGDVWEMANYVWALRKPKWEREAIRHDRAWDPIPPAPVGFI